MRSPSLLRQAKRCTGKQDGCLLVLERSLSTVIAACLGISVGAGLAVNSRSTDVRPGHQGRGPCRAAPRGCRRPCTGSTAVSERHSSAGGLPPALGMLRSCRDPDSGRNRSGAASECTRAVADHYERRRSSGNFATCSGPTRTEATSVVGVGTCRQTRAVHACTRFPPRGRPSTQPTAQDPMIT